MPIYANSPAFKVTSRAMAWGGFSAFSALYCLQPLMPMLSADLHATATAVSGVISVSTAGLAISLIPASIVARKYGLKPVMCMALAASALFTLMAACASGLFPLLICRGLLGIALAGFPAIAMAYLSEEIDPLALGQAMGAYIAGNALGGLCGRLIMAFLADWLSWRIALGTLGILGSLVAFEFWRILPASTHFEPQSFNLKTWWNDTCAHWTDAGLLRLFLQAFLFMGCYVSFYNYLGYRLVEPPFGFRPSWLGLVSCMNLIGMLASNWAGKLADRHGRRKVLWWMIAVMIVGLIASLTNTLIMLIFSVGLFTFGFFGAHAIASSWVGRRAHHAKALAASFYLFSYYLGSSVIGSFSGYIWEHYHWQGIVTFLSLLLLTCTTLALQLRKIPPLPNPNPL